MEDRRDGGQEGWRDGGMEIDIKRGREGGKGPEIGARTRARTGSRFNTRVEQARMERNGINVTQVS